MFDIEYKGGNTVVISTKKSSLVTDPKMSVNGEKDIVIKDGVELVTEERFATRNDNYKLTISYPGNYEISDFTIAGYPEKRHIDGDSEGKKSVIYGIDISGVKIGLLGNIGPNISDDQLENLGVLDILILPIGGGGYTLDATSAVSIVRAVDPKVVIPVHYRDAALQYEVPQDEVETFIKELGAPVENVTKFKVKNDSSLPSVLTTVVVARS